jgi:hypothetical protein
MAHSSGWLCTLLAEESLTAKSTAYIYLSSAFTGHYSGNIHFRLEKFCPVTHLLLLVISTTLMNGSAARARRRIKGRTFLRLFQTMLANRPRYVIYSAFRFHITWASSVPASVDKEYQNHCILRSRQVITAVTPVSQGDGIILTPQKLFDQNSQQPKLKWPSVLPQRLQGHFYRPDERLLKVFVNPQPGCGIGGVFMVIIADLFYIICFGASGCCRRFDSGRRYR